MKKYRIPALLLSLVLMLNLLALPAAALEEPELQCTNAILVDANYGEVLYAKKADEKAYPASHHQGDDRPAGTGGHRQRQTEEGPADHRRPTTRRTCPQASTAN